MKSVLRIGHCLVVISQWAGIDVTRNTRPHVKGRCGHKRAYSDGTYVVLFL